MNTPKSAKASVGRPDVEEIAQRAHWSGAKDRILAGWKRSENGAVLTLRVWAALQPPQGDYAVTLDLLADHIEALEARQVMLEEVVELVRLAGLDKLCYGLGKTLAALGDGDG